VCVCEREREGDIKRRRESKRDKERDIKKERKGGRAWSCLSDVFRSSRSNSMLIS
jgi:hypothetical protein